MRNGQIWMEFAREGIEKASTVAKFLCTLHVTNTYILTPAYAYGPSMLPTLNLAGNLILSERITPRVGKIRAGDIVTVQTPYNPRKFITKRVKGMEGDEVTYFIDPQNSEAKATIVVPKGHVWVEGDNMYASTDSREFGAVPYGLIQGKVFWRIWPFKDFGPV